ncbi:MAG: ABC transporter ATP-binding protein/permease [Bacteriovoracaceae bacterium]|nr:ABC transporter ATP-binding protein/permease [Bacteriovoracaceae bacterium]
MNTLNFKWYKLFFQKAVRGYGLLILLFLSGAAYLGHRTPHLIKDLSESFLGEESIFYSAVTWLLVNFVLVYINRVFFQLTVNKYIRIIIHEARSSVFAQWLKASEKDADKYPQGEIISRVINDTEAIRELITSGAFGLFIDLFFVTSCLIGFISLHPFLGWGLSLFEIISIVLLIWGSSLMREFFVKLRTTQAMVNRTTSNVVGGVKQLYYTDHQSFALKKTSCAFDLFLKAQNQVNAADALYYAIAESLYPLILIFMAFILPFNGFILAALLMALIDLIQRSINPIKEISGKIANIQRAQTGLERIEQFLNDLSHDQVIRDMGEVGFQEFIVKIKHFEYPRKDENQTIGLSGATSSEGGFHIHDVEFTGKKGQLVGIVGLSGSGKSTVMNILCGSLSLLEGELKIVAPDKVISVVNSQSQDWNSYRNQVSLVSQDSHIFSESLFFNLSLGFGSLEQFQSAWEFYINEIPYLKKWGLSADSKIEPHQLSLGQRQLLAGLRACYLRKNIVLFDEISSAMDSELELALRSLILLLQSQSLTLIVAHRLETLIQSHHLLIMDKGRLIDSGNHSELITRNQIYQQFVKELSLS